MEIALISSFWFSVFDFNLSKLLNAMQGGGRASGGVFAFSISAENEKLPWNRNKLISSVSGKGMELLQIGHLFVVRFNVNLPKWIEWLKQWIQMENSKSQC